MLLPATSAYNIAKLAICRFTRYMAFEYADQGILAMAVHLGAVAAGMGLSLSKELHVGE